MSIEIGPPHVDELKPRITVIGVGGAGGNAIANMIASHVDGVDFVVANTDAQALNASPAERRIQLGPRITEGLGAGSRPDIGRAAAEETIADVERLLDGCHMCFIAAGMGGGTGTGAAPVIAKAAKAKGVLTVGVVTKPFTFEGTRRARAAEAGIEELQKHVDTLIVIPNQNLFLIANPNTTFKEAFLMADEVLQQGVRGITDLMVMPGLINLDFADVRSVMEEMGKAMMGTGEAEGDGRALEAAEKAIANPLLDGVSMRGAKGVIVSIVGGEDMRLMEVDEAANHIRELVDPDANIIWGSAFNENLNGKIRVSVVATGIDVDVAPSAPADRQPFSLGTQRPAATPSYAAPAPFEAPVASAVVESTPPVSSAPFEVAPADDFIEEVEASIEDSHPAAPINNAGPFAPPPFANPTPVFSDDGDDELVLDHGSRDEPLDLGSIAEHVEPAEGAQSAATKPSTGGTLFERMSSLARGNKATDADGDDADDRGFEMPRFLNRQNNQ